MDKYLSSEAPPVPMLQDKKYRRESASVVDEFFSTEKPSSTPYSVNINVILPDTTHLRTGLYRPPKPVAAFPPIKTEPGTGFSQPCSSSSTQTLPDFTSVFSMPQSVAVNNIFVKQEMAAEMPLPAHPQQPQLFQMPDMPSLASSSSSTTAISCLSGVTMATGSVASVPHRPLKQYPHVAQGQGSFGNIPGQFYPAPGVTLPPSPPNSQPGSPENQPELINTISPPPSYEATFGLKLVQSSQIPPVPNGVGGLSQGHMVMQPPKYNRRNNPELEKRRIHHCDYPGVPAGDLGAPRVGSFGVELWMEPREGQGVEEVGATSTVWLMFCPLPSPFVLRQKRLSKAERSCKGRECSWESGFGNLDLGI